MGGRKFRSAREVGLWLHSEIGKVRGGLTEKRHLSQDLEGEGK